MAIVLTQLTSLLFVAIVDHVTIRVRDLARSAGFYDRVFEHLGFAGTRYDGEGFEWDDFSIGAADGERAVTTGLHVAFTADSREQIDGWWSALTEAGYDDLGAPGPRPEYGGTYYGAFVADPDGNSIEAVRHETTTPDPGLIDHLWIRVGNLEPTRRFYTAVAAAVGLTARERPNRLQVVATGATFSFLEGDAVTRNLHLAIGVDRADVVDRFHRDGLQAGGLDNGAPGERPRYHVGYYGAYLLDPDGNNVEAVYHDRSRL